MRRDGGQFYRYSPSFFVFFRNVPFSIKMLRDVNAAFRDVPFRFWMLKDAWKFNRPCQKKKEKKKKIYPEGMPLCHSVGSFTYSIKSAGWQFSIEHILSMLGRPIYLPSRRDCITPSANNFSFLNLLVLYPASFRASRMFILYLIKAGPPFLLGTLFHYPHYSTRLHRKQCKKLPKIYTDICVICEQTLHR